MPEGIHSDNNKFTKSTVSKIVINKVKDTAMRNGSVTVMANGDVRVSFGGADKLRRASVAAAVAAANKKVSFSENRRRRMSHVVGPTSSELYSPVTVDEKLLTGGRVPTSETVVSTRTPSVQRAQSHREVIRDSNCSGAVYRHSASFQCPKRSSSFHENILRHGENYQVLMLGAVGVGKSSLVRQFQVSNTENVRIKVSNVYGDYCRRFNDAQLVILDNPAMDITAEMALACCDVDAYVIVYSVTDRDSFHTAQTILKAISSKENFSRKAAILVGNKVDLVRRRVVTTEEGKACATDCQCKFIETSDWIDYNVDELFEGVLTQIRLRLETNQTGDGSSKRINKKQRNYRRSKTLGAKSWGMLKDLINKINRKVKSCDDLYVL